jgi:hypothetical protein
MEASSLIFIVVSKQSIFIFQFDGKTKGSFPFSYTTMCNADENKRKNSGNTQKKKRIIAVKYVFVFRFTSLMVNAAFIYLPYRLIYRRK